MTGVRLDELHCPTCGDKIVDFNLHADGSLEQFQTPQIAPSIVENPLPRYLLCPRGHKWSVKMIWRGPNQPDRVQLDRYLGDS